MHVMIADPTAIIQHSKANRGFAHMIKRMVFGSIRISSLLCCVQNHNNWHCAIMNGYVHFMQYHSSERGNNRWSNVWPISKKQRLPKPHVVLVLLTRLHVTLRFRHVTLRFRHATHVSRKQLQRNAQVQLCHYWTKLHLMSGWNPHMVFYRAKLLWLPLDNAPATYSGSISTIIILEYQTISRIHR